VEVNKHINEVIFVTYYPPELKANVVKNRVEKGKSCSQLSKDYNIPERNVQKWVKKCRDWDENYTCFFNNSINKSSVVSHNSKVPPVIYEEASIDLDKISQLCIEYPNVAETLQDAMEVECKFSNFFLIALAKTFLILPK